MAPLRLLVLAAFLQVASGSFLRQLRSRVHREEDALVQQDREEVQDTSASDAEEDSNSADASSNTSKRAGAAAASTASGASAASAGQAQAQGSDDGSVSVSSAFSKAADAAMSNITAELSNFQQVVQAHSARFAALLQQEEQANAALEAQSASIAGNNKKLEQTNADLEKDAKSFLEQNKQLRSELKVLEKKLRSAQLMAKTVSAFQADSADQEENEPELELDDEGDLEESFLVVSSVTRTSLARGVKDLAQQEEDAIAELQRKGQEADAQAKKVRTALIAKQKQLNATEAALEQKRSRLQSSVAHLASTHQKLEARVQSLTALFMRLAAIASGKQPEAKPAAALLQMW